MIDPQRPVRAALRLLAVTGLMLALMLVLGLPAGRTGAAAVAAAQASSGESSTPAAETGDAIDRLAVADRPGWGASLDWQSDSGAAYTGRLGRAPAVLEQSVGLPLTPDGMTFVAQFFDQAAATGAVPLLQVVPQGPMTVVDDAAVAALTEYLRAQTDRLGIPMLVSLAPEMNSTWRPYGQDPRTYRDRYRSFAASVRSVPGIRTVWMPAQGTDYPFRADSDRGTTDPQVFRELDTDGDGRLTSSDDPYQPYYPGDDVVDWGGLAAYWGNPEDAASPNATAPAGEFAAAVAQAGDSPFLSRYVSGPHHPLLVGTAARYRPDLEGAAELAVKQSWWRQAIGLDGAPVPGLQAVVWRETTGDGGLLDWRATADPLLAGALRADLTAAGTVVGPLYGPVEPGGGPKGTAAAPALSGIGGWTAVAAVTAAAIALTGLGFSRRSTPWRYPPEEKRDLRIDLLRGVAITFVVVNHIDLPSLYQLLSQEAIGAVSGAELFVLLSGVVVGMVYRPRMERNGLAGTAGRLVRRAWKLYYTALIVILSIFLISRIPGIDATAVTTFTDQGTGTAGTGAAGVVYNLYGRSDLLFSYPVPPSVLLDIALLRVGPWQFNVIGLYVVLLLVAPLLLWGMRRHLTWVILGASWLLYVINAVHPIRLFPSQFEDAFPLLTWQVLFINGTVVGYHRVAVLDFFRRRTGRAVLLGSIALFLGFLFFSWNNPYQANAVDVRLALLPDDAFRSIYQEWFTRVGLRPGRLLNVVVVVITFYALLTAFWRPISRAVGGFFIPLGGASLYVFIMHVYFVVLLANIGVLTNGWLWLNTLAYTAVLALLWLMVRHRFLFRWVPR